MDVTSYLLGKQAGGGTPINNQNKDVTITENGTTTVSADADYTGLGTVGITASVQPDLESKSVTITENGTTTVTPTTGKDGLSQVSITTNVSGGGDVSEYFNDTSSSNARYAGLIKKIPGPIYITGTDWSSFFYINYLTELPRIASDMSNVTKMTSMFSNSSLVKNLDLSYFNTSNVTAMNGMFNTCSSLETLNISSFNFEKCTNIKNMFFQTQHLKNLTFGYDLGKGYLTSSSANNANYTLDLSLCNQLTHDSLMSVINGLYDIATAGVQPQQLVLGNTNLAKLSQAEIDIATNKGWTLL